MGFRSLRFPASPGSENQGAVGREVAPEHLGERPRLLDQLRGREQLAGERVRTDAQGEGDGQHRERTGLASELEVTGGQRIPGLVVPHDHGGFAGEPQPAERFLAGHVPAAKGAHGLLQHRHPGGVSLGELCCQTIEEEVGGVRGVRGAGAANAACATSSTPLPGASRCASAPAQLRRVLVTTTSSVGNTHPLRRWPARVVPSDRPSTTCMCRIGPSQPSARLPTPPCAGRGLPAPDRPALRSSAESASVPSTGAAPTADQGTDQGSLRARRAARSATLPPVPTCRPSGAHA
jgi:hypothetical protein